MNERLFVYDGDLSPPLETAGSDMYPARTFFISVLMLLVAPLAQAGIDGGEVEQLMRLSGLSQVIDSLPQQIDIGFREGLPSGPDALDEVATEQVFRAVAKAYAAERLKATVRDRLGEALDAPATASLLAWYRSDQGRRVTRMELASLDDDRDIATLLAANTPLLEALSAHRRALLERAISATRAAELAADLIVNTTLGLEQGLRLARGLPADAAARSTLSAQLARQRPALVESFTRLSLAMSVEAYQPLPDGKLGDYVAFLETPAARRFHAVGIEALNEALFDAARLLGRLLPARDGQQPI